MEMVAVVESCPLNKSLSLTQTLKQCMLHNPKAFILTVLEMLIFLGSRKMTEHVD